VPNGLVRIKETSLYFTFNPYNIQTKLARILLKLPKYIASYYSSTVACAAKVL
jgi:hypothetical protein